MFGSTFSTRSAAHVALVIGALLSTAEAAKATTTEWQGNTSNDWTDPTNWISGSDTEPPTANGIFAKATNSQNCQIPTGNVITLSGGLQCGSDYGSQDWTNTLTVNGKLVMLNLNWDDTTASGKLTLAGPAGAADGNIEIQGSAAWDMTGTVATGLTNNTGGVITFTDTGNVNGTWTDNDGENWGNVVINKPGNSLTLNTDITCTNLTLTAGTLNLNGFTLTVTGTLTINGGTLQGGAGTSGAGAGSSVITNNFTFSTGTYTEGAGNTDVSGNFNKSGGTWTNSTGVVRFTGAGVQNFAANSSIGEVELQSTTSLTLTAAATVSTILVNTAGTKTIDVATFTLTGSTLTINATFQLNIAGTTGTLSLSATPTIAGTLQIGGGIVNLASALTAVAATGTITQSGGTLRGALDVDLSGLAGNYTATGGTFELTGAAQNLTIGGASGVDTFFNVLCNGSSDVTVVAGTTNFRVDGTLTLNNKGLTMGTSSGLFDMNGATSISIASGRTLNLGNVSAADIEGSVTFGATGVWNVNSRPVTLAGNFDATAGGTLTSAAAFTFDGAVNPQTITVNTNARVFTSVTIAHTTATDVIQLAGAAQLQCTSLSINRGNLTVGASALDVNGLILIGDGVAGAATLTNGAGGILAGGGLTLDPTDGFFVGGANTLTFDAAGTWTGGGASYGAVVVTAAVSAADAPNVGSLNVTAGALTINAFTLTSGGSVTVTGAGLVVTSGGVTFTNAGAANWSGATVTTFGVVQKSGAGTLSLTSSLTAASLDVTAGVVALGGNTLTTAGSVTIAGTGLTVGAGGISFTNTGAANWTGSSVVSFGVVAKSGAGTLTATTSVTVASLNVSAGVVDIGGNTLTSAGSVVITSTGLTVTGGGVTFTNAGAANWTGASVVTYGVVQKSGAGTLTATTNVAVASLDVTAGAVALGGNTLTSAGSVTITGTGLTVGAGGVSFTNAGAANWSGASVVTFGVVDKSGAGTLTATTSVAVASLNVSAGVVALGGSTLTSAGSVTVTGAGLTVGAGGVSFTNAGAANWTGASVVSFGVVAKSGAGTLSATTNVAVASLNVTAGVVGLGGNTLTSAGSVTITGAGLTVGAGGVSFTNAGAANWSGASVVTFGVVDKSGVGTLTATTSVAVASLNVSAGVVALGGSTLTSAGSVTVTGTGLTVGAGGVSFTNTGAANWTGASVVSFGVVAKSGAGTLTASDVTVASLNVTAGVVDLGANTLTSAGSVTITGAGLTTTTGGVTFANAGAANWSGASVVTFGVVQKSGAGTLSGTSALTMASLAITGGTVSTASNFSVAGATTITGATLSMSAGTTTLTGGVSGTGSLTVSGGTCNPGTFALTGTVTHSAGTINFTQAALDLSALTGGYIGSGTAITNLGAAAGMALTTGGSVTFQTVNVNTSTVTVTGPFATTGSGTATVNVGLVLGTTGSFFNLSLPVAASALTLGTGNCTVSNLNMANGAITLGGRTLTVSTGFTQSGGSLDDSNSTSSILDVNVNLIPTGGTIDMSDGTLRFAGTTLTGTTVTFGAASTLELDGLTAAGTALVTLANTAPNLGKLVLNRQAASDVCRFQTNAPTLAGTATLTQGTLDLTLSTTFQAACTLTANGRITATTGALTHTFQAGLTMGGGQISFTPTTGGLVCVFNEGTTFNASSGTLTVTGQSGTTNFVTLRDEDLLGSSDAQKWFFTNQATQAMSRVRVQDSTASTASCTANSSVDEGGNNANWIFPGVTTTWTRLTALGAGLWSDSTNWSDGVPAATGTAVFDNATLTNAPVTVDVVATVAALDVQAAYTGLMTINATKSLTVSTGPTTLGNVTANGSITVTAGATTVGAGRTVAMLNGSSLSCTTLTMAGNVTLGGASAGNLIVSGAATIGGTLTLAANGTATLNGTVTNSAGTPVITSAVASSSLNFGGTTVTLTGIDVTLTNGTTSFTRAGAQSLVLSADDDFFNVTVNGGGTLTTSGAALVTNAGGTLSCSNGNVTLGNFANVVGGGVTISAGTLTLSGTTLAVAGNWNLTGAAGFAVGGTTVNFNGTASQTITSAGRAFGAVNVSNTGASPIAVTFSDATSVAGTLAKTNASDITFSAALTISAAGSLTKAGAGTMTLASAANTVAGNVTVSGGTLTLSGTTLDVGGSWTLTGASAFNPGGTNVRFVGGAAQVITAAAFAFGPITINNTAGGVTTVGALSCTSFTNTGGAFSAATTVAVSGPLAVNGGTYAATGATTLTTGTGTLSISGAGASATLGNAANSIAANVDINNGTLVLTAGGSLAVGGNWDSQNSPGPTTFTHNGVVVTFNGGGAQAITADNDPFGSVTVTKAAGTATFTGPVTFAGNVSVTSGNMAVTGDAAIGGTTGLSVTTAAAGGYSATGATTITGAGADITINGAGAVVSLGNAVNTVNDAVAITAGTLQGGGGGSLAVGGNWTVAAGATSVFTHNSMAVILNGTLAQAISQPAAAEDAFDNLTCNKTGTASCSNLNVGGTLTVQGGTLQLATASFSLGTVTVTGGLLTTNSFNMTVATACTVTSPGELRVTGATTNITPAITGTGLLNQTGGTLNLNGGLTMTGQVTQSGAGTMNFAAGTVNLAALTATPGFNSTSGTAVINGATLVVDNQVFFSNLTISASTVMTGSTAGLNVAGTLAVNADLTITAGGNAATVANLTVGGTATLTLGATAGDNVTVGTTFTTIAGTTVAVGARTLTLNGTEVQVDHEGNMTVAANGLVTFTNGYSSTDGGDFTNIAGTLSLGGTAADFTNALCVTTFAVGGTLDFIGGGAQTLTIDGNDSLKNLSVNKTAATILSLSAATSITNLNVVTGIFDLGTTNATTALTVNGTTNIAAGGTLQNLSNTGAFTHTFALAVTISGTFAFTTTNNQTGATLLFGADPNGGPFTKTVTLNPGCTVNIDGSNPGAAGRRIKLARFGGAATDQWSFNRNGVVPTLSDVDITDGFAVSTTTLTGSCTLTGTNNNNNWLLNPKTVVWSRPAASGPGVWSLATNWDTLPAQGDLITFAASTAPSTQDMVGLTVSSLDMTNYTANLTIGTALNVTGSTTVAGTAGSGIVMNANLSTAGLSVGTGSAVTTNGFALSNTGTLAVAGTGAVTVSSGGGTMTVGSTTDIDGTLTVNGAATFTGDYLAGSTGTVNGTGTLNFNGAVVNFGTSAISMTGGTTNFARANNQTLTCTTNNDAFFNVIVNVTAPGTALTVNGGGLFDVNGTLSFVAGNLTMSGAGSLLDVAGPLTIPAGRTLTLVSGTNVFQDNLIVPGVLTLAGGTLQVAGDLNLTGATFTLGGTTFDFNGALAAPSITLAGQTLGTVNISRTAGTATVNDAATFTGVLTKTNAGNFTFGSTLTLGNNFTQSGTGTTTFTGALGLTGNLSITAGNGNVTLGNATHSISGTVGIAAGTLQGTAGGTINVGTDWTFSGSGVLTPNTATVRFNGAAAQAITPNTASAGQFAAVVVAKTGGTASVTGAMTCSTLAVQTNGFSAGSSVTVNGGNLAVSGGSYAATGATVISAGNLLITGGTVSLGNAANSVSGTMDMDTGTLTLNGTGLSVGGNWDTTNNPGPTTFTHNNTLVTFNGAGAQAITPDTDAFGPVTVNKGNTATFTAATVTASGLVTVTLGGMQVNGIASLGAGLTVGAGTYAATGATQVTGALLINGGGSATLGNAANTVSTDVTVSNGSLIGNAGGGSLTFNGNWNTTTGGGATTLTQNGMTVVAGGVAAQSVTQAGDAFTNFNVNKTGTVTFNDLNVTGTLQLVAGSAALATAAGSVATLDINAGQLSTGTQNLAVTTACTIDTTGTLLVAGGTTTITPAVTSGTTSGVLSQSGGTLNLNGGIAGYTGTILESGGTTVFPAGTHDLRALLAFTGSGTGTAQFTGPSTIDVDAQVVFQNLTVTAGLLTVANTSTSGLFVNATASSTLTLSTTAGLTLDGAIGSGPSSVNNLTFNSTGTLTLGPLAGQDLTIATNATTIAGSTIALGGRTLTLSGTEAQVDHDGLITSGAGGVVVFTNGFSATDVGSLTMNSGTCRVGGTAANFTGAVGTSLTFTAGGTLDFIGGGAQTPVLDGNDSLQNLSVNKTGGTLLTLGASTTLTVQNLTVATGTLDLNTGATSAALTVNGTTTVAAGGTLQNLANNSGTVIHTFAGPVNIDGTFTFTTAGPNGTGCTIRFGALLANRVQINTGAVVTFDGATPPAASERISLRRFGGVGTDQWFMIRGAVAITSTDLDIQDGNIDTGTTAGGSSNLSGNNTNWGVTPKTTRWTLTGGATGNWSLATNWDNGVPSTNDTVEFDSAGTAPSNQDIAGGLALNTLNMAASGSYTSTLTLSQPLNAGITTVAGTLATNGQNLTMTTLAVNGQLAIATGGLVQASGAVTSAAAGSIVQSAGILRFTNASVNLSSLGVATSFTGGSVELTGATTPVTFTPRAASPLFNLVINKVAANVVNIGTGSTVTLTQTLGDVALAANFSASNLDQAAGQTIATSGAAVFSVTTGFPGNGLKGTVNVSAGTGIFDCAADLTATNATGTINVGANVLRVGGATVNLSGLTALTWAAGGRFITNGATPTVQVVTPHASGFQQVQLTRPVATDVVRMNGSTTIADTLTPTTGTLDLNGTTLTVTGNLTTVGSTNGTIQTGAGTLVMNGQLSDYDGTLVANGGTLDLNGDVLTTSAGTITATTLCALGGNAANVSAMTVTGNVRADRLTGQTVTLQTGATLTSFNVAVTAPNVVTLASAGAVTLGNTTVTTGILSLTCSTTCATTTIAAGQTLRNNTTATRVHVFTGPVSVGAGGTLQFQANGLDVSFGGGVANTVTLGTTAAFTAVGTLGNNVTIRQDGAAGNPQWFLDGTAAGAVITASFVNIRDGNCAPVGTTANNAVDQTNNTGWVFGSKTTSFVGGQPDGGLWSNPLNWNNSNPVNGDEILFTATGNAGIVDVSLSNLVRIDMTNYTGTTQFNAAGLTLATAGGLGTVTVVGTLDLRGSNITTSQGLVVTGTLRNTLAASAGTVTVGTTVSGAGTINFSGTTTGMTVSGATADFGGMAAVTFGPAGQLQFAGGIAQTFTPKTGGTFGSLTVNKTGGTTVTIATNNLTLGGSVNVTGGGLDLGGRTVTGATSAQINPACTLTTGAGSLSLSSLAVVNGQLNMTGGTVNVGGSFSGTGNLTCGAAANLRVGGDADFSALTTVSFTNSLVVLNGTANPQLLQPSALASFHNLQVAHGTSTDVVNVSTNPISCAGNLLVTSGNLTPAAASTTNVTQNVTVGAAGTLSLGGGRAVVLVGNAQVDGVLNLTGGIGGTFDVGGDFLAASAGTLSMSNGTLNLRGSTANFTGLAAETWSSTGTVAFVGTATPVSFTPRGSTTYGVLRVNKGAAAQQVNLLATPTLVGGQLDLAQGVLALTTFNLTVTSAVAPAVNIQANGALTLSTATFTVNTGVTEVDGSLTVTGAGVVDLNGSVNNTSTGTVAIGSGTLNASGATVDFSALAAFTSSTGTLRLDGAVSPQTFRPRSASAIANLDILKGAGDQLVNLGVAATTSGALTVSAGSFMLGGNNVTVGTTASIAAATTLSTGAATLQVAGTTTLNGQLLGTTGTVDLNGDFPVTNAGNLVMGTGTLSAGGTTENFSGLASFTWTTGTLVLDGNAATLTFTPKAAAPLNNLVVNKNAAAQVVTVPTALTVNGTTQVTVGILDLQNAGTFTGAVTIAASQRLRNVGFNSFTYTFGSTIQVNGAFQFAANLLVLNFAPGAGGQTTVSATGTYTVTGGTGVNRITMQSSVGGSQFQVVRGGVAEPPSGNPFVTVTDVRIGDSTINLATTAFSAVSLGNLTNWIIGPKSTQWTGGGGTNDWTDDFNWSNSRPASSDVVTFASSAKAGNQNIVGLNLASIDMTNYTGTLTLQQNLSATGNMTLAGTVLTSGFNITASTTLTIATGGNLNINNNTSTVTVGTNLTINGTLTAGLGLMTVAGDVAGTAGTITGAGGTVQVTGATVVMSGVTSTYTGSFDLVGGLAQAFTPPTASAIGALRINKTGGTTATLQGNGSAVSLNVLSGALNLSGRNLNVTTTAAVTAGTSVTTGAGTFTVGTVLTLDGSITADGGALTVNGNFGASAGSALVAGSGTITVGGTTVNFGSMTTSWTTGTLVFNGTNPQTFTPPATPLQSVTITKGALGQTVTLASGATANGVVTITTGTLVVGANTLSLNAGGTPLVVTGGTGAFTMTVAGTIQYTGAGVVNVTATTYTGCLRLAGAGTYTLTGPTTVGCQTIVASGTLDLNGQTLTLTGSTPNTTVPLSMIGGAFLASGGSVVYQPTAATTYTAGAVAYANVTFNGAGSIWTAATGTSVSGTLALTAGTLRPAGPTFNVGDVTGSGTFDAQGAAITVNVSAVGGTIASTVSVVNLTSPSLSTFVFASTSSVTIPNATWGNVSFTGGAGAYAVTGNTLTLEGDLNLSGGSLLAAATSVVMQGTQSATFSVGTGALTITGFRVNKSAPTTIVNVNAIGGNTRTFTGLVQVDQGTVAINASFRLFGNTVIGLASGDGTKATLRVVQPGVSLQLGDLADTVTVNDTLLMGLGNGANIKLILGSGTTLALQGTDSRLSFNGDSVSKLELFSNPTGATSFITAPGSVPNGNFSITNCAVANSNASGVVNGPIVASASQDGVSPVPPGSNVNWQFVGGGSVSLLAGTAIGQSGRITTVRVVFSRKLDASTIGGAATAFALRQTDGAGNVLNSISGTTVSLVPTTNGDAVDVAFGAGLGRTDIQDVEVLYSPPATGQIRSFDGLAASQSTTIKAGGTPPLVDGAAPAIVSVFPQDIDGNGGHDRVVFFFSEPVTFSSARGVSISGFEPVTSTANLPIGSTLTLKICGETLPAIVLDGAGPQTTGDAIASNIQASVRNSMLSPPPGHNPLNRPAIINFTAEFLNGRYVLRADVPLRTDPTLGYVVSPSNSTVEVVSGGGSDASALLRLGPANGGQERAGSGSDQPGFASSAVLPNIDTMGTVAASTTATLSINGEGFRDFGLADASLPATLNTLEQLARALELKVRDTTIDARHLPNKVGFNNFVCVPDRVNRKLVLVNGSVGPASRVFVLSEGNTFGTSIARIGTDVSGTFNRAGSVGGTASLADLTVVAPDGQNLLLGRDGTAIVLNASTVSVDLANQPNSGVGPPSIIWRDDGDLAFVTDRATIPNIAPLSLVTLNGGNNVRLIGDGDGDLVLTNDPGAQSLDAATSIAYVGTAGVSIDYGWAFVSGPATPTNLVPSGPRLTFSATVAGTYKFRLTMIVRDALGNPVISAYTDSLGRQISFVTVQVQERPPVADAGADLLVLATTTGLNGTGSFDPNGGSIAVVWSATNSLGQVLPASAFTGGTTLTPTFTPGAAGVFTVTITVTKVSNPALRSSDSSQVTLVNTANLLPQANAGVDQVARVGELVTLDGGASLDPEGSPITYRWSIVSVPSGGQVTLSDPFVIRPTFTATLPGSYVFDLVVSEGTNQSSASRTTVRVQDDKSLQPRSAPGAVARAANLRHGAFVQTAPANLKTTAPTVLLSDGATSRTVEIVDLVADLTDDPTASAIQGLSRITLTTGTTPHANLYVRLQPTDGDPAQLVLGDGTSLPLVAFGVVGSAFTLDGSRSTDDGVISRFDWTQVSGPAVFVTREGSLLSVVPPAAGTYVFDLVCTDAIGLVSFPARVVIPVVPLLAGVGPPEARVRAGSGTLSLAPAGGIGTDDYENLLVIAGPAGSTLSASAADSFSRNGGALSFAWDQVAGPIAILSATNSSAVQMVGKAAGYYRLRVRVTDANGVVALREVAVVVHPASAQPIVVEATKVPTQKLPATKTLSVQLQATGSRVGTAPSGATPGTMTYVWTQTSGVPVFIQTSTGGAATINVTQAGDYLFLVSVTDGSTTSAPATVRVHVEADAESQLASGATTSTSSGGCALTSAPRSSGPALELAGLALVALALGGLRRRAGRTA